MKAALYDLKLEECPVTFDYYAWLAQIRLLGYDHVNFWNANHHIRTKKYGGNVAYTISRFESIIWPGPLFHGMTRSIANEGDRVGNISLQDTIKLANGRDIPRMRATKASEVQAQYTVTLRRATSKPERNSDEGLWREFARNIGALVIRDYSAKPIALEDRMAIYAQAKMNFGVMGGPMSMLIWTPYPACIFCDPTVEPIVGVMCGSGLDIGEQWAFQQANQRHVWKTQTMDNLMAAYEDCIV